MKGILQHKFLTESVKDVDIKNKVVTGYLSAFDNKDFDGDIIPRGAFKRSLDTRRDSILFLNQHNWEQPHGKFAVLTEDQKGLYFESNPLIDTTYSSDAIKLYAAGIIKEHSIGFNVIQEENDEKSGARVLKEIKLYEGSNVTLGANPETPFNGFKNYTPKECQDLISKIMKMLKDGTLTDDGFIQIEIALKQLQKHSIEIGKALNLKPDPRSTSAEIDPLLAIFSKHSKI